jgi:hypothetical protein
MNATQRKANSVEMKNTNDHRDAKGGLRRLRRPQVLTYAAVLAILAAMPVATAAAHGTRSLARPTALQTFKLRLGDARTTAGADVAPFSRTPSFAWAPVRRATHYEFQLSTSKNFGADNGIIWSSGPLTTPAAAPPIALPWITGSQTSLYWHVRALGDGVVSAWSGPRGFNMRWVDVPRQLPSQPGYVRWKPVAGATGYDVWFTNLGSDHGIGVGKIISTITTVADEREYYTKRQPSQLVEWRVRARRQVYGKTSNGLPSVSYGPWSGFYFSSGGTAAATTPIAKPLGTISAQVVSAGGSAQAHALMPAFVFTRDGYALHRIYIATDKDCVNIVHVGSIVGGTAYAPRVTGPLALNPEQWDGSHSFLPDGSEGKTMRSDGEEVTSNEAPRSAASGDSSAGSSSSLASSNDAKAALPAVDLWDSNWDSGRYYWTVVPVVDKQPAESSSSPSNSQSNTNGGSSESRYQDVIVPQDACQAGNVGTFQKRSTKPRLSAGAPYVTGLSPSGRLLSAASSRSSFYGLPLVAWTPSTGATAYDVEWSRTNYPWRKAGSLQTPATSALLPLTPGTWYYRVRGIDPWLPGNTKLAWSGPVRVHIARPTFSVHGG